MGLTWEDSDVMVGRAEVSRNRVFSMKLIHKELRSWQEDFLRHPEGESGIAFCVEQHASVTQLNGEWRVGE